MKAFVLGLCLLAPASVNGQALTISTPGTYVLHQDYENLAGPVVAIYANDVVLDLNGFTIRCIPPVPSTAITFGIAAANLSRVTVKNGRVTGCFFGMHAGYGEAITVRDVDFSNNTYIGLNLAGGRNNTVERVVFGHISGYQPESYAIGLNGIGTNGVVEGVVCRELYKQPGSVTVGEGLCVLVESNATNVQLRRVTFTNTIIRPNTMGIWVADRAAARVEASVFTGITTPMAGTGVIELVTPPEVVVAPPPPPLPPPLPPGPAPTTITYTMCIDTTTCYAGTLTKVGGQ